MRLLQIILLGISIILMGFDNNDRPLYEKYMHYNIEIGNNSFTLNGKPVTGWKEIYSTDGYLEHKGYYSHGKLLKGMTYYKDGTIESFIGKLDGVGAELYTYQPNGHVSTRTAYRDHKPVAYKEWDETKSLTREYSLNDHFEHVEYDRSFKNGKMIQELILINPDKSLLMEYNYYEKGGVKSYGKVQLFGVRGNREKIGRWVFFDEAGNKWTINYKPE